MQQKNITVYYQKEFNPYAKYTDDQLKNLVKHILKFLREQSLMLKMRKMFFCFQQ